MNNDASPEITLKISVSQQSLVLYHDTLAVHEYPVSTALKGVGEVMGSGCTPMGNHKIRIKIGETCPSGSVFVGRRFTGEVFSQDLANRFPGRDWILTRILWLTGCDSKLNRGGNRDTLRRYIYIHGCPDSEPMGRPLSHGCIRMRNADVIELFNLVENGTRVNIIA